MGSAGAAEPFIPVSDLLSRLENNYDIAARRWTANLAFDNFGDLSLDEVVAGGREQGQQDDTTVKRLPATKIPLLGLRTQPPERGAARSGPRS